VFLLIKDAAIPRSRESPLARLGHVFPQAIAASAIADHRLALTSYLDQAGIAYQERANERLSDGLRCTAGFISGRVK
jgi:hypothetical protein